MKRLATNRLNRGLSLIELLIALAISAAILAGLTQFLVTVRQTERMETAMARMQETGRLALNYLDHEIRQAGYQGCLGTLDTVNTTLRGNPDFFRAAHGIEGWDALDMPGASSNGVEPVVVDHQRWAPDIAGILADDIMALPGTDVLRVWGVNDPLTLPGDEASAELIRINHDPVLGADTSVELASLNIKAGDVLLASDCERADWVQACRVDPIQNSSSVIVTLDASDPGNTSVCSPGNKSGIRLEAAAGGQVSKVSGNTYYVGRRANDVGSPPALFMRAFSAETIAESPVELVEGIAGLQLEFGVDIDQDARRSADVYLGAGQIDDPNSLARWKDVVSVRFSLLVESVEDNLLPVPQPYDFFGELTPSDRRLRRVFTTTVNLRNRTL